RAVFLPALVFFSLSSPFCFPGLSTTATYSLSLHDALPIYGVTTDTRLACKRRDGQPVGSLLQVRVCGQTLHQPFQSIAQLAVGVDRKSTRLNSSHVSISYAVFCLKKKKQIIIE